MKVIVFMVFIVFGIFALLIGYCSNRIDDFTSKCEAVNGTVIATRSEYICVDRSFIKNIK